MSTKTYILGIVFGLLVPLVGVFAGLQISSMLGNVLAFPFLIVAIAFDAPIGHWGSVLWTIAFVLSIMVWVAIFALMKKFVKQENN